MPHPPYHLPRYSTRATAPWMLKPYGNHHVSMGLAWVPILYAMCRPSSLVHEPKSNSVQSSINNTSATVHKSQWHSIQPSSTEHSQPTYRPRHTRIEEMNHIYTPKEHINVDQEPLAYDSTQKPCKTSGLMDWVCLVTLHEGNQKYAEHLVWKTQTHKHQPTTGN